MVRRARFLTGAGLALVAGLGAAAAGASPPGAALVGWNLGALAYVALSWRLFLHAEEADVRMRAAEQDETRSAIFVMVVAAVIASLAAIVWLLATAKSATPPERSMAPLVAVVTLVISWVAMQTIFVLHYAHRHFADPEADGTIVGGFKFAGDPATTYRDFIYLSFGIGAAFQVSDIGVTRSDLRNLVAAHSALAYFYNTAILALGINIVASLIGR